MITITLPDDSQKQFNSSVTVFDVAQNIGAGLAKATLAGVVDGHLVDASHAITENARIRIITEKDEEGLDVIRHSCAHLLAQAVKQLYPDVQVTIGPVIDNGFYYDFAYNKAFTPDDLEKIEQRMHALAEQDIPVSRKEMSRDDAIAYFKSIGEDYKVKIIEKIASDEILSIYEQGDFSDLCRGPHVPSTKKLKAFKLTKVAGAYWEGDAKNEMLQRIYGTAWANKKDLANYLHQIEEAEKRDHRKIGKALNLFHMQEEAPGMVFWHPRGWTLYRELEHYIRIKQKEYGYQEIRTPIIMDRSLWERSGHMDKFHNEMFVTETENRQYAIKPMNCPGHIQVYNQGLKSYRDLPLRFSEYGCCHRSEPSGTLHGLMRVRQMQQDDAHVFCTPEQVKQEVMQFNNMLREVYTDFGFEEIIVLLATRPENRLGDDALWDRAEADLEQALDDTGMQWTESPGEGAFYGPKVEYSLKDSIGRIWQLGTLQLDYCLPERLDAQYVAEDGSKKTPVMLHRAILGSFERFIGIVIENYAGLLPLWLTPEQVVVMNITDKQNDYCESLVEKLQQAGLRATSDLRNEKIGFKIREHTLQKVPYQLIIGEREMNEETVSVRERGGKDLGSMTIDALISMLQQQIINKK